MADFIFLMHDDAPGAAHDDWEPYLSRLRETGVFLGGSAIAEGHCFRKAGAPPDPTTHLTGFIHVTATSLAQAQALLAGNPVFEAGGTVEIRSLARGG